MKKLVLFSSIILSLLFYSCSKSNNTEPVANLPSEPFNPAGISIDSLIRTVSELSGEKSVTILGSNYTISTRSQYFEGNNMAAEYLKSRFKSLGLNILDQKYSSSGRNILAIQQGEDKENYFIICGHYDCCPDSALAPGADDNASACSVVLEAARLISKLRPKYSVIYALWDEEERGQGSQHFADSAFTAKMKIRCVLNADMIGYDINNSRMAVLWQPQEYGSLQYADIIKDVNTQYGYGINLIPKASAAPGDGYFFYAKGFTTVDLTEKLGFYPKDPVYNFNKYYHTSSDRLDKFDKNYFENMSKLAITSFAKMIGLNLSAAK
ncbi:MAG TPA: M28 family metallopeptidase [Ignavibacteriales bacterium]|nr:M28 family metallopeptidase [Ignavibacteriales bacterium]